jgi:hypothetical protein
MSLVVEEFNGPESSDLARKEIGRCKEDFMCDLKSQCDGYKYVARI